MAIIKTTTTLTLKRLITKTNLVLTIGKIFAHEKTNYNWSTLSFNSLYDFQNGRQILYVDLNTAFLFIKAGLGYKEPGNFGKNGTTGYSGPGKGNKMEFLSGFSANSGTFTFLSDLILIDFCENFLKKHP